MMNNETYRIGHYVPALTLGTRIVPALVQYTYTYAYRAPRTVSVPAWI